MKNQTSLVAFKRVSGVELVMKYPLASDDVGLVRGAHEVPRAVGHEGNVLGFHSIQPVGILERSPNRGGGRRSDIDGRDMVYSDTHVCL
jgi:hypothetical protein